MNEIQKLSTKQIAEQALAISQTGILPNPHKQIDFSDKQRLAENQTQLYRPQELADLYAHDREIGTSKINISVTRESTQQATYRLVVEEQKAHVCLLNFASAKNAGGGFLSGAKAQEEDLCRSSGLYLCQLRQPEYYEINRKNKSMLYTDHMIYSPNVPFFRINKENLLDDVFLCSVITAPAPNAGVHLQRCPHDENAITETLIRRTNYVLSLAKQQGHKILVLGAWGCGVFRNDPVQVAKIFDDCLKQEKFAHAFDEIVFAIYDSSKTLKVLTAFENQFKQK
ncbi:TIGR02452 family protein [Wielerella bovis]|uniref:TIGR02452 family protein n=1 Tax=Wielerella bovis TaxID=2917790 RepID=UPI002018E152|nr:TIGR02452 family protein [Wielerella bovis]ULJ60709.1 TIGR02452 family protein [Wielerella bovis]